MKINIFIALLMFSIVMSSQQIVKKTFTRTKLDIDKNTILINNKSGERIPYGEFHEIMKKNNDARIVVKDEDVNGKPLSYYVITSLNAKNKSYFDFDIVSIKRNDIFGTLFNLEIINEKRILIIHQMNLNPPRVNVKHLKEAEEAAAVRGYVSVILTYSDAKTSKEFVDENGLKSVIIPNAKGLMGKFNSSKFSRFPMYYILGEDKKILSAVENSDEVDLVIAN